MNVISSQTNKKGIFTSLYVNEETTKNQNNKPNQNKFLAANEINSSSYNGATSIYQTNQAKKKLAVEHLYQSNLNDPHFSRSNQQQYHIHYGQKFVPPPPQIFLQKSGHQSMISIEPQIKIVPPYQQIHMVPQYNQPTYQTVTKQYIPHHIYNEIPVMNSETKRVNVEIEENDNEDERVLIEQYEKLYDKYVDQRKTNQILRRQIQDLQEEKQSQTIKVVKEKIVEVEKPTKINVKLLTKLLHQKQSARLNQIIERHRSSCLQKLQALFNRQDLLQSNRIQTKQIIRNK